MRVEGDHPKTAGLRSAEEFKIPINILRGTGTGKKEFISL
jgi:hypothetical protein